MATAGALGILAAGPAPASPCTDQIDALEKRLNDTAAAASSGGQGVAAAREARATQRAAEAAGGGDRLMQAKATPNRARSFDAQGNSTGCMEAVAEARRQIGN